MLGEAAMRIIRTKWKNPFSLAEELYTLLSKPLDIQPSSIVINQPAGATIPPIVINQPAGTTQPPIQINRGGDIINVGGSGNEGGGGGNGGGGINFGDIIFPEQNPADVVQAVPTPNENPIALHGRIAGKVSGQTYKVRCWAKDPNATPAIGVLTVIFPGVDANETIPDGTVCPVIAFPGLDGTTRTIIAARGYASVFLDPGD